MATVEPLPTAREERIRLFEEVPDLLPRLEDPESLTRLARVTTEVVRLDPGSWTPAFRDRELRGMLGLLAVDGLLTRRVAIGEANAAEVLGAGDVLRPWTELDTGIVSVPAESCWQVVLPTRLAVLSARFASQIGPVPEVMAAIIDRVVQRARWLSFHLAICHIVGIEVRLLIVLWHFADRWGRVTPAGVKVPIPISHELLAGVVGARRPTVSTALGALRDQGLVERADEGWILHGEPPVELHELRARVAGRSPTLSGRPPGSRVG